MARKKGRKKRHRRFRRPRLRSRQQLEEVFSEADELVLAGQAEEAVKRLERLLPRYSRSADVHYYLGYAYTHANDPHRALEHYEQAARLAPQDSDLQYPLAMAYQKMGMFVHSILALRRFMAGSPHHPLVEEARRVLEVLDAQTRELAASYGVSERRAERAIYLLEQGRRALHAREYAAALESLGESAKLLPRFAPPHNNQALALFFLGEYEKAIAVEEEVLEKIDPTNIHALANLVHFYAVIEREDRAEGYLNRLAGLEARQADDYRKMAEAYASLERDQQVYDWLTELEKTGEELGVLDLFFLGVAAANLGKRREARHCWKRVLELDPDHEKTHRYLAALERGQPGPGWTSRYPYFSPPDLMPEAAFQEFIQMMGVKQEDRRRQGMERLVARYPQLVKVITKLLYEGEEEQVASALVELGTPEALAVVRDFAFGQVGSDEARRHAAFLLLEAGALPADQPLRLWQEGKWREVLLRRYEIVEEEPPYNPRVARRLERATQLLSQGKRGQAKKALRQLIAQHPEVKEAHHNLGAAYFQEGDLARAEESFRQALALDPDYVFARANLASICIEQDRLDEAEELLRPIPERTTFRRPELIFYQRVVAELHIVREEYDAAEAALKFILDLEPEDEAAQERLMALTLMRRSHDFFARWRERDRRRRERKRARFVVGPDTGLQECLEQLTKDALTGTRRALPRWMASNLRKAELIEAIVEALTDRTMLQEVVTGLSATEQEALAYVLAQGGLALWDEFAQRYGDDMEESPYWNWHEPQTVMGRLRLHGLLAEGTAEDQAVVLVPQELRRPLEEILKSRGVKAPSTR